MLAEILKFKNCIVGNFVKWMLQNDNLPVIVFKAFALLQFNYPQKMIYFFINHFLILRTKTISIQQITRQSVIMVSPGVIAVYSPSLQSDPINCWVQLHSNEPIVLTQTPLFKQSGSVDSEHSFTSKEDKVSHDMTKPTKWHVRTAKTQSAWACAQSEQSSLGAHSCFWFCRGSSIS